VLLLNMLGVSCCYSCVSCAFIRDQKCNNMVQILDRLCVVMYGKRNFVIMRSLLTDVFVGLKGPIVLIFRLS